MSGTTPYRTNDAGGILSTRRPKVSEREQGSPGYVPLLRPINGARKRLDNQSQPGSQD